MGRIGSAALIWVLGALLVGGALAQSNTPLPSTSPKQSAPIGHRQPDVKDLPPDVLDREGSISPKAKELDRKLNICRGC